MRKKILLFILIFSSRHVFAEEQSLGPIVQRQFKQIQELKAELTELKTVVSKLQTDFRAISTNVKGREAYITATETKGEILGTQAARTEEPNNFLQSPEETPIKSLKDDKAAYDLALAALKDGNFNLAEEKFANFIANFPTSNLLSNASFWHAETFYRKKDFNNAAINFLQCYKQFPKSAKAPDALLKLAYALGNLEKHTEACGILEQLDKEFPSRPENSIKRAKEAKNKFHCK